MPTQDCHLSVTFANFTMPAMRILVVEDDLAIAGQIGRGLATHGHHTTHAATGKEALAACNSGQYDAMVLDRMLPDINGLTVIHELRVADRLPPVLMLSALGSVGDRVDGLVGGADDYLTKPFDMSELTARLVALRRRSDRAEGRSVGDDTIDLVVGRLQLDAASHRVVLGTEAIGLNRKQFSLLVFLMRRPDQLVTRAMLLEGVWGYAFDPATNIVESNLSRLRGRLQMLVCDPIETRRGEGYLLRSDKCT